MGEEQGTISNCSNCVIKTPNRREERRGCAVVLCCVMCIVTTLVNSFQYKLMCACFVSSYSSFFLDKTKVWLSFTVNKIVMQHYLLAHCLTVKQTVWLMNLLQFGQQMNLHQFVHCVSLSIQTMKECASHIRVSFNTERYLKFESLVFK